MQCFQKDPNLRVTARKLLRHAWIVGCRRSEPQVAKAPSNFSQAVEEVKQWNKALKSSETSLRASTGSDGAPPMASGQGALRFREADPLRSNHATPARVALAKPRALPEAFRSPELADDDNWDNDFATSISPSALHLPHLKPQDNFGGLLSADRLKAFASTMDLNNSSENYDDDFEGELLTIKVAKQCHDDDALEKTIRPITRKIERSQDPVKSHSRKHSRNFSRSSTAPVSLGGRSPTKPNFGGSKIELPARPDLVYREESVEDFSDLQFDNDHVFSKGLNLAVKRVSVQPAIMENIAENSKRTKTPPSFKGPRQSDAPQLFHPSDLTSLPRSMQSPAVSGSIRRQISSRPSVLPDRSMRRSRSSAEIERFVEPDDDEDFSDILGPGDELTPKDESDHGSENGFMLASKLSSSSWLGDDDDEDDPFASMDPGWDELDLKANIARDRHARLCERVEELVRSLKTTESEDILCELAEDLVCHSTPYFGCESARDPKLTLILQLVLLWENPEVKGLIITAHGLLPILEILEPCTVKTRQHMILQLLKVVNTVSSPILLRELMPSMTEASHN